MGLNDIIQRAYDDGYLDGRLDIEEQYVDEIKRLKDALDRTLAVQVERDELKLSHASLVDQVDYWRNLVTAETHRLNALLALQIEQADEIHDDAYGDGWNDGLEAGLHAP